MPVSIVEHETMAAIKQALERYLGQATYLHGCHRSMQMASNGKMTLKELCDLYLKYQDSKVLAGELTPKHHNDQVSSVRKLISFLGARSKDREYFNSGSAELQKKTPRRLWLGPSFESSYKCIEGNVSLGQEKQYAGLHP